MEQGHSLCDIKNIHYAVPVITMLSENSVSANSFTCISDVGNFFL